MKLGMKLLFPIVATALVATAGGLANGVVAQWNAKENARVVTESLAQQRAVASAREQMAHMHAGIYRTLALIASLDEPAVKAVREALPRQVNEIQRAVAQVAQRHPQAVALARQADAMSLELGAYAKSADEAIDLASVDPNTGVAAMQSADIQLKAASEAMVALVAGLQQMDQQMRTDSAARTWHTTLWVGLISVLVTTIVVMGSARMLRRMAGALRDASLLAEAVAAGDLSPRVAVARGDEIGDLQRSLARMVAQLRVSLLSVRDAARGTAVASSEIASGNQDLSDRTEQTASRLQQAAASMADLSAAVGQAADAAAQANALAATTSLTAERSGATVGRIVENMEEISVSSRRIGDIIGVIDGIAFQTNLLALNAAVEAARAGERGRGFAVVAGEVRNLAKRSAEAAKEIKTLIEHSVDKVGQGTRLVREAGGTMGDLVASVRQVNDIIREISERTAGQRHDIEQLHEAVDQLDQMTQQIAALVEQSAAAAGSMQQQAQSLSAVVTAFQLDEAAGALPA